MVQPGWMKYITVGGGGGVGFKAKPCAISSLLSLLQAFI